MIDSGEIFKDEGGIGTERNGKDDGGEVARYKDDDLNSMNGDEDDKGSEHDPVHFDG